MQTANRHVQNQHRGLRNPVRSYASPDVELGLGRAGRFSPFHLPHPNNKHAPTPDWPLNQHRRGAPFVTPRTARRRGTRLRAFVADRSVRFPHYRKGRLATFGELSAPVSSGAGVVLRMHRRTMWVVRNEARAHTSTLMRKGAQENRSAANQTSIMSAVLTTDIPR